MFDRHTVLIAEQLFSPLFIGLLCFKNRDNVGHRHFLRKENSIISANKICNFYSALVFCLHCSIYNMGKQDKENHSKMKLKND